MRTETSIAFISDSAKLTELNNTLDGLIEKNLGTDSTIIFQKK